LLAGVPGGGRDGGPPGNTGLSCANPIRPGVSANTFVLCDTKGGPFFCGTHGNALGRKLALLHLRLPVGGLRTANATEIPSLNIAILPRTAVLCI